MPEVSPHKAPMDLASVFRQAEATLEAERNRLNQMDESNHNHGDHMVAIFHCASQAAEAGGDLPQAMTRAAAQLRTLEDNGSARVYARGLECLAKQLQQRQIGLEDLLLTVRGYLPVETVESAPGVVAASDEGKQGETMKALLNALSAWEQAENAVPEKPGMDLGYLFGVGMAYLQAKQKGGDRLDVLAETLVSASPLGRVPHRHASGVLAVRSLLNAMRSGQVDHF